MADRKPHHDQFDRFAQDAYLKTLLDTAPEAVIPTLFLDLMNRVNKIEGHTGLILAELERASNQNTPVDHSHVNESSVNILGGAVDMSNILKALMEYYEMTQPHDDETKPGAR
ncbi:MAG: hypothetical protein AAF125_09870 [Chloroflexota bacterium]